MLFYSYATNLVSGDTNGANDIFLRRLSGFGVNTRRINVTSSGGQTNGSSFNPTMSADGR